MIPIDFHIFQRGRVQPPTSHVFPHEIPTETPWKPRSSRPPGGQRRLAPPGPGGGATQSPATAGDAAGVLAGENINDYLVII